MPELTRQLPITKSAHKTAVVGDALVATVRAGLDMTTEDSGPAVLDRRHDFELLQAQVSGLSGPIGGTGGTQDVGDLERGTHPPQPVGALSGVFSGAASMPSLSSGLITARTVRVATLV